MSHSSASQPLLPPALRGMRAHRLGWSRLSLSRLSLSRLSLSRLSLSLLCLLLLFGSLLFGSLLSACSTAQADTISLTVGSQTLKVELALTQAQQARGLMYRDSMPENAGMLFVYSEPQQLSFWMKNTFIPLSIAYIGPDARIINIADMVPNNASRTYPSRGPAQYALEVNAGWFEKHGIREGDKVKFELPARSR